MQRHSGPRRRRDARGRANRAGQFICPSEYERKGAPAKLERSELSGATPPGRAANVRRMTEVCQAPGPAELERSELSGERGGCN